MRTNTKQREELRGLEAKATKGPWEYDRNNAAVHVYGPDYYLLFESSNSDTAMLEFDGEDTYWDEGSTPNFKFITSARNALPALLDDLDEAVEQIYREHVANNHDPHTPCTCHWCEAYRARKEQR